METEQILLVDVVDRVAIVTMHRPEARNALNRALRRALVESIETLDADDDVDVFVLTGSDPAFCAGLDLKEFDGNRPSQPRDATTKRHRGPLPPHRKPIIGAVNGVAMTGGLELALNCDFLVASEKARFADTHSKVGVQPGWGLTVLLPQAIGLRRAKELSLTGRTVDAETALAWGLVNYVVPHAELMDCACSIATDVTSNDSKHVLQILDTYSKVSGVTGEEGWRIEASASRP